MFLRILLACVVLIYAPSVGNQFNVDDVAFLRGEMTMHFSSLGDFFTKNIDQHYAPLNFLLNVLLFRTFPPDPLPFHLLNIAFFLINVFLFYALVRLLSKDRDLAFLASLLFCLHPMNVTIVDRISFNIILVCMAAVQGSLICLILAADGVRQRFSYAGSILLCLVALFCQELAILIPVYAAAMLFFARGLSARKTIQQVLPHVLCVLAFLAIWVTFGGKTSQLAEKILILKISVPVFLATFTSQIFWYLSRFFFPIGIVFIRNTDPLTDPLQICGWLLFFALSIALVAIFLKRWGKDIRSMALLWFGSGFILAIPATFVAAYMGLVIEPYWFYISSMGFFILAGVGLRFLFAKFPAKVFWPALASLFLVFFAFSYHYHAIMRTSRSYLEHWLKYSPDNHVALLCLANLESEEGNYSAAKDLMHQILSTSRYPLPYIFKYMAMHALMNDDLSQARHYADLALRYYPNEVWSWNTLGVIELRQKNFIGAERNFQKALSISPTFPYAFINLVGLHFQERRFEEADDVLSQLESLPLSVQFRQDVAIVRLAGNLLRGRASLAQDELHQLLQQSAPGDIIPAVGQYLDEIDEAPLAIKFLQAQLPSFQNEPKIYLDLGDLFLKTGDSEGAKIIWQDGLNRYPQDQRFQERLAGKQNASDSGSRSISFSVKELE